MVDARRAVEPEAPQVHDEIGSNVAWDGVYDWGDIDSALESADHVIEVDELHFHRFSSTPLECSVVTVSYDAGIDTFNLIGGCAMPQITTLMMSAAMRHPAEKIRIVSKDFGGSFGVKIGMYVPATAVALLSRETRPADAVDRDPDRAPLDGRARQRTLVPQRQDGGDLHAGRCSE